MSGPALRVVERDNVDKGKALEAALGQIERSFGKGSIMRLGQRENLVETEVVSTGSSTGISAFTGGISGLRSEGRFRPDFDRTAGARTGVCRAPVSNTSQGLSRSGRISSRSSGPSISPTNCSSRRSC